MTSTITDMAKTAPSEAMLLHEIRMRAYDLYEHRGKSHGHDLEDWLQAESEVLRRVTRNAASSASSVAD